jgi:uncharacterized membrane protein YagU involved in acid resistance
MNIKEALLDTAVGMASGFVGTKVMEPVAMGLYKLEPESARRREDDVRPGPPYEIAAEKTAGLLGMELEEKQLKRAGMAFHYGLGMSWGSVYTFMRRTTNLSPLSAGLMSGAAMSLLVDEGLTPLLGFSAPNRAYPAVTHVRGFVAHLAFGVGVAVTAEGLYRLLGEGRERQAPRRRPETGTVRERELQAAGVVEALPGEQRVR